MVFSSISAFFHRLADPLLPAEKYIPGQSGNIGKGSDDPGHKFTV
jgi:hypothetical protein